MPIISRIRADYTPPRAWANDVRTAQANIISAFGGYLIDTDSYARAADDLHYTKAAQETHGIDIATKFLLIN